MIVGSALILGHILLVTSSLHVVNSFRSSIPPIAVHAVSAKCALILLAIIAYAGLRIDFWITFCVLAFGVSSFLFLFGAVYKSLSLRLLLETEKAQGRLSFEKLDESITAKSFLDRAVLLCSMGLVFQHENGYRLSEKGKRVLDRLTSLRKFFRITTIGLY
jgi:hypothetical protein